MSTTLTILIIVFLLLGYLYYKIRINIKENDLRNEKMDLIVEKVRKSEFKYVVIIRTNDKIYKDYEHDKLGNVGYHIYTKHAPIIGKHGVYILDNVGNEIMKIEKDTDSECMIGVDHPEHGHIGYLSFISVERID